jgi:Zn-dependent protease
MWRSWKIGRAFGIDFYIHWTLFLLPGLTLLANAAGGAVVDGVYLAALYGAMFCCVALHELGHALTARRYGIPTRDITLYPIGGVARLERMSERPVEEFWIALAGPAVNVVIAAVIGTFLLLEGFPLFSTSWFSLLPSGDPLVDLLRVNIILVVFNMIPAFPMDGGRVLRAALSAAVGPLAATEAAATIGAVAAIGLGAIGLFWVHSFLLAIIALFIYFAGQQELAMVRQREAIRRAPIADVLPAEYEEIPRVVPVVPEPFSGIVWNDRDRVWVVWRNGRPVYSFQRE